MQVSNFLFTMQSVDSKKVNKSGKVQNNSNNLMVDNHHNNQDKFIRFNGIKNNSNALSLYSVSNPVKVLTNNYQVSFSGKDIEEFVITPNEQKEILLKQIHAERYTKVQASPLQRIRQAYQPKLPQVFVDNKINNLVAVAGDPTKAASEKDADAIKEKFPNLFGEPIITFAPKGVVSSKSNVSKPKNVAVILSGGQAPGGHNVISGLFDSLKQVNSENKLFGYLGGPSGLIKGTKIEINDKFLSKYRNTGGFDIIGSGRTKLEDEKQFEKVLAVCKKDNISSIVIIGGDDSNTNAALLAEYFRKKGEDIQAIGVPKTIDGDLKNAQIDASFGFDTATRTYSELIGNVERDALSAKKYWHFVKLMGRSASHVTLECALQTHPNLTIISEEVADKKMSLGQIVDDIAKTVATRSVFGKNYGVVLIPEGVIEFVPEMKRLISNLNDTLADSDVDNKLKSLPSQGKKLDFIKTKLDENDSKLLSSLPKSIQEQLIMDRDAHGNVQVSKIETDKLLVEMVKARLEEMKEEGKYNGKFSAQSHFFGYEGRCASPTNFDADYCYSLGHSATALIESGVTGYMASVRGLDKPAKDWTPGGIPITMMMNMEKRKGKDKPVIKKALVDTRGSVFKELVKNRKKWAFEDHYLIPGPIQYFGPAEVSDQPTKTLLIEKGKKA